jgi:two-component system, NtrC family, sensor kinase
MSFRSRILLALLAVGVIPVVILGRMSYEVNRKELTDAVGAAQTRAAADIARQCESLVIQGVDHLETTVSYIPFARLSPAESASALRIPFRQLPWLNVLVLLDERGAALAGPVFDADPAPGEASREPIGPQELDAFARSVPLATVLASDVAIGPPYRGARTGAPRVAIAIRVEGAKTRVLGAEVSLQQIAGRLQEIAAAGEAAFLVDARGQVVAHGAGDPSLSRDERLLVDRGASSLRPESGFVRRTDGDTWLATFTPVGTLGWGVVLAARESVALRGAWRAGAFTVFWAVAALVTAGVLGALLARGVSVPVARLSEAARALTEGRPGEEVVVTRRDELGDLAGAFNHMAREVRRRDEEIRRWNDELARRVAQKAAELRIAQDQVARTRRLAAIGSLGAGVAHEINNPMTAVVGLVSVVRKEVGADSRTGQLLGTVLQQATRVTRIIDDLRRLAESQQGDAGIQFPLVAAVRASVEAHADAAERAGISLRAALEEGLAPIQGDPLQIQELVGHLLRNAIAATPEGGEVRVSVSAVDGGALKLQVADTGRGIPEPMRERIFDPFFTRKERGGGIGLGLTLSSSIVEAHHGKIHVESEEGEGTIFTVLLPAAVEAHLS